jgi:hypothetical protein
MSTEKFMDNVLPELKNMMGAGRLDPEVYAQLIYVLEKGFTAWAQKTHNELNQKATDWEKIMGPEREGFYSLGLRRSADLIIGKENLEEQVE